VGRQQLRAHWPFGGHSQRWCETALFVHEGVESAQTTVRQSAVTKFVHGFEYDSFDHPERWMI
jgi:hypothetical protein